MSLQLSPSRAARQARRGEAPADAQSPRARALAALQAAQTQLSTWEQELLGAETELETLREQAGAAVLAEPAAASRVATEMGTLRDRVEIAGRAVDAARPLVEKARRAVLLAEADEQDPIIGGLRGELAQHDAKAGELLEALQTFTGAMYVPEADSGSFLVDLPRTVRWSVRDQLVQRLDAAVRTQNVLRAVAEGQNVHQVAGPVSAADLPASVFGPGAVIPAPGFVWVDPVDTLRADLAVAEQDVERATAAVERGTAEVAKHRPPAPPYVQSELDAAQVILARCVQRRDAAAAMLRGKELPTVHAAAG